MGKTPLPTLEPLHLAMPEPDDAKAAAFVERADRREGPSKTFSVSIAPEAYAQLQRMADERRTVWKSPSVKAIAGELLSEAIARAAAQKSG